MPVANSSSGPADRILALLRAADGQELTGVAIARALGVSRSAVWKQMALLRANGYVIEAAPGRGYRFGAAPQTLVETEVRAQLRTTCFGSFLRILAEVDSTNRHLVARAEQGGAEGDVIAADAQTAGRGRLARTWFSPPGRNLYFSVLLRPAVEPALAVTLPLLAGCTVANVLAVTAPELDAQIRIKWPNDIWLGERKLCGVLCEMQAEADRVHHVVVGIGLNVNLCRDELPPALDATATSLAIAAGHPFDRAALLAALLERFESDYRCWSEQGLAPFLADLRARDLLCDRPLVVEQAGRAVQGRGAGIQADGSLTLVAADGSRQNICSGDVHVRMGGART